MHVVRNPTEAERMILDGLGLTGNPRTSVASVAVLLALVLSGSAKSGSSPASEQGVPEPGISVRLADCQDWQQAGASERAAMIRAIGQFAGGPVGTAGGHGATLEDGAAYELFQTYCANTFAGAFKLYKIYARAAAFGGPR